LCLAVAGETRARRSRPIAGGARARSSGGDDGRRPTTAPAPNVAARGPHGWAGTTRSGRRGRAPSNRSSSCGLRGVGGGRGGRKRERRETRSAAAPSSCACFGGGLPHLFGSRLAASDPTTHSFMTSISRRLDGDAILAGRRGKGVAPGAHEKGRERRRGEERREETRALSLFLSSLKGQTPRVKARQWLSRTFLRGRGPGSGGRVQSFGAGRLKEQEVEPLSVCLFVPVEWCEEGVLGL
jgi:hypothetical protein